MKTGTVKWFNPRKGFGFLTSEDGEDVFVHYSAIVSEGFRTLERDQVVTFDITHDESGRTLAANVKITA